MKNVFIASILAGAMAVAVGCESKTETTGQAGTTAPTNNKAKSNNSNDALGNSQSDDGVVPDHAQNQAQDQSQNQVVDTPANTTPAETTPVGTGTIAEKYKNVPRKSAQEKAALADQGYAKIDNHLKVAIIAAAGDSGYFQNLNPIIPPGEQLMAPRSFDGDPSDSTTLTLKTDDGRTCRGTFNQMSVAGNYEARMMGQQGGADWRASVEEDGNGGCYIKENAGGGGGGGGGGGANFK